MLSQTENTVSKHCQTLLTLIAWTREKRQQLLPSSIAFQQVEKSLQRKLYFLGMESISHEKQRLYNDYLQKEYEYLHALQTIKQFGELP